MNALQQLVHDQSRFHKTTDVSIDRFIEKTRKSGTISQCISRENMCHFYMVCPLDPQSQVSSFIATMLCSLP